MYYLGEGSKVGEIIYWLHVDTTLRYLVRIMIPILGSEGDRGFGVDVGGDGKCGG